MDPIWIALFQQDAVSQAFKRASIEKNRKIFCSKLHRKVFVGTLG